MQADAIVRLAVLLLLGLPRQVSHATPSPPYILVNEATRQCYVSILNDECMSCDPPPGWKIYGPGNPSYGRAVPDLSNLLVLSKAYSQTTTALKNPPADAAVEVVAFSADRVEIVVDSKLANSWLVQSDAYDPDWHATVNGKATYIERAHLAFKAIPLSMGRHFVVLVYGSCLSRFANQLAAGPGTTAALTLFGGLVFALLHDYGPWTDEHSDDRPSGTK